LTSDAYVLLAPYSEKRIGRVYRRSGGVTVIEVNTILARMISPCLEVYGIRMVLTVEKHAPDRVPPVLTAETGYPPDKAAEIVRICIAHVTKRIIRVKEDRKLLRVKPVEKREDSGGGEELVGVEEV